MANGKDKNYVSVWFWVFALIVLFIPLVNVVMTLIWAFVGENESRKNYFKALILFWVIALAVLFFAGVIPILISHIQHLKK